LVAILRVLCVLAVTPNKPPGRKEREEKLRQKKTTDLLLRAIGESLSSAKSHQAKD